MLPTPFSSRRALEWLQNLSRAAGTGKAMVEADLATLATLLAHAGAEPVDDADAAMGARVRGRETGPPWLVCAPAVRAPAESAARWRPNAHGSGAAVLLTLLEALTDAPPAQDVLCLLFPATLDDPEGLEAGNAWAARDLLPLQGVVAVWQVAAPGLALDLDLRSLVHPQARALKHELFSLGQALGHEAFARGVQTAFPGPHVPFLERGLAAVPLCANADLAAGSEDDQLADCSAESLQAVGETLLRFLRGERVV